MILNSTETLLSYTDIQNSIYVLNCSVFFNLIKTKIVDSVIVFGRFLKTGISLRGDGV